MGKYTEVCLFVCFWRNSPQWVRASSFMTFLGHTQRRTTVDRTPLDKWSARRRDLYLTTHTTLTINIHAPGGIRTHNLNRRAAADLRLRPRGHWDRQSIQRRRPKLNSTAKWDTKTKIKYWSVGRSWRFDGSQCIHLQGKAVQVPSIESFTLYIKH